MTFAFLTLDSLGLHYKNSINYVHAVGYKANRMHIRPTT